MRCLDYLKYTMSLNCLCQIVTVNHKESQPEQRDDSERDRRLESRYAVECWICLEEYKENDEVVISSNPSCKHMFHKQCILEWLTLWHFDECPCCRQSFVDIVFSPP